MSARIAVHAANAPGRVALTDGRSARTYGELVRAAGSFAAWLERAERRGPLAVVADKSIDVVTAMVGAWRAGVVTVPVDPSIPAARLRHILERIDPAVVIGRPALHRVIAEAAPGATFIAADAALAAALAGEATPTGPGPRAEDDAYCLFTSGSTGLPKGVRISHGSVAAFFHDIAAVHPVAVGSRCLNTSPLFFDVSVLDIFFPLARGATVRLLTDPFYVPARMLAIVDESKIEFFCAVAPLLRLMIGPDAGAERFDLASLRTIMTGADVLDPATVQRWLARVPGLTVLNGYGPTEATCVCLVEAITAREPGRSEPYPIGVPLANVRCVVLGEDGAALPSGAAGELLIGGPQLLTGYWRDPDETARRCVTIAETRYYRTGDRVVRDASGCTQFLGRVDDEVKISGYRIHLAEIRRAALREGEGEVIVGVIEDAARGRTIVAAIEGAREAMTARMAALRARLAAELPAYMVPRWFVACARFPRLGSGKVDVRRIMTAATQACVDRHDPLVVLAEFESTEEVHCG